MFSVHSTAEARDCLCQFRMEVLRKPDSKNMVYSPTHYAWKLFCPHCYYQPCIENFSGFHPQVWSITLLCRADPFRFGCKDKQKSRKRKTFGHFF